MKHVETEEFLSFLEFHFNAVEVESYRLLVLEFKNTKRRLGLAEGFIYKVDGKKYHLYFFVGRDTFYTLAAHLERKGEPRKEFSATLKNYLEYLDREGRT